VVKVLVACEFSGVVRDAFAAKGHNAWSCDLLPSERPGQHIHGDVIKCPKLHCRTASEWKATDAMARDQWNRLIGKRERKGRGK